MSAYSVQFLYAVCKFTVCHSACVQSALLLADGVYVMLRKEGVRAALFADNVHSRLLQGSQQRIVGKRHGHFWTVEYVKKRSAVLLYLYD